MKHAPDERTLQELRRLRDEAHQAERQLEEAVKRAFPSGTICRFHWGSQERVVRICRNFGHSVSVVGVSGSEYAIPAYRLYWNPKS